MYLCLVILGQLEQRSRRLQLVTREEPGREGTSGFGGAVLWYRGRRDWRNGVASAHPRHHVGDGLVLAASSSSCQIANLNTWDDGWLGMCAATTVGVAGHSARSAFVLSMPCSSVEAASPDERCACTCAIHGEHNHSSSHAPENEQCTETSLSPSPYILHPK